MKRVAIILTLLACAVQPAQAQGTIQFRAILTGSDEVPPNSDPTIGRGSFTLDGNSLSFLVDVSAVNFTSVSGYIQGPALPGANGPIIFDLGAPRFLPGDSQGINPPVYRFFSPEVLPGLGAGPFPLTGAQISELEGGFWYVNVTSSMLPNGQLRGQILPVPEPSTQALFGLGSGLAALRAWKKQAKNVFHHGRWTTLGFPSPRPSPIGRGRMVHCLSITPEPESAQLPLAKHQSGAPAVPTL